MSRARDHNPDAVLVVEDDDALRSLLVEELEDAGYEVAAVGDAEAAQQALAERPADLVISDLRLPGADGMHLLQRTLDVCPAPGFIMITAFGTVEQAVEALKQGADDFLTKPLKLDHVRICAERVIQRRRLQEEVRRYRELLTDDGFHGLVGRSVPMLRLFDTVRMVARVDGPVLVTGESGTGKELVARAIHAESDRSTGAFVAVNCAGIPSELLESELFGHMAGAFTGASRARRGLFAEADGGTLLLDEIGEMPVEMQAKLLRVLEDGRVRPVGADREQRLDVRVIAATNLDLEQQVSAGCFRQDLYFRLETFAIHVPPLRDRGDDIELLTARFISAVSLHRQRDVAGISADALARIRAYAFPGNVRELSNSIERAVAYCPGREIDVTHLPARLRKPPERTPGTQTGWPLSALVSDGGSLPALEEVERAYIRLVLERLGGNKRRAADVLGIGRRTLYRRLESGDLAGDGG